MKQNQFMGILRAVLPAIVAYAVGKGWLTDSQAADVGAAVLTLAAAGWSVYTNIEKPTA